MAEDEKTVAKSISDASGMDTQQHETLEKIYENIVKFSIEKGEEEVINILNDYYWTINTPEKSGDSISGQIPFVYVSERRQLFSSQITNIINSIMSLTQSVSKVGNITHQLSNIVNNLKDTLSLSSGLPSNSKAEEPKPAPQATSAPKAEDTTPSGTQASGSTGQQGATTGQQSSGNGSATPETQTPASSSSGYLSSVGAYAKSATKAVKEVSLTSTNAVLNTMTSLFEKLGHSLDSVYAQSHVKDSSLLYPYMYLYATAPTKKHYVFPLLTDDAAKFHLTNQFSESAGDTNSTTNILSNGLTAALQSVPRMVSGLLNDMMQFSSFMSGDLSGKNFNNNWVEMGKFYNYSTDGDEVTITFPLFNTVKKDEWQKNHKFCFAFALRNMPFKVDNTSYKMPLLYDVQIPGVKRMPFAYVSQLNIQPKGIVRTIMGENYLAPIISTANNLLKSDANTQKNLSSDNKNEASKKIAYNIPEAWLVQITFKDLVGASANKVLAQLSQGKISGKVSATQ